MSIFNPTLLPVIVNQYTKFEVSFLNGCGDIFDKKVWRERKRNKYKEEQIVECPFAIPQYNLSLQISISILNGCGDIFDENSGETEKKNKYREEQIGEGPSSIPRYNLSL